jgi:hypothetical protein
LKIRSGRERCIQQPGIPRVTNGFQDGCCSDEFHPDIHGENTQNREFGRAMQGRLKAVRCKTDGARQSSIGAGREDRRIIWAEL